MVLQVLTADLIDGRTKKVKWFTLVIYPIIDIRFRRIDSKFTYERNNETNDNPTFLLDQNRPGPSALKWEWRIVIASGTCNIRGLKDGVRW